MACDTWHIRLTADQMLIEFCTHFTSENKELLYKLTTSQAGFHSANAAISKATKPNTIAASLPVPLGVPILPVTPTPVAVVTNNRLHMYYCWTHSLGFNCNHTSTTCSKPADGHNTSTTVKNLHGGNNTIMSNRHCSELE